MTADSSAAKPRATAAMLRGVDLFEGLDDVRLVALARELPTVHVEPGDLVVKEGGAAGDMFVVMTGELEILKATRSGVDVRVALIGPGDWFGEMGVLDVNPRSATVRSLAPTMLVRLTPDHVRAIEERDLRAYAILMRNLARELTRRLRVADNVLAQFMTTLSDVYASGKR